MKIFIFILFLFLLVSVSIAQPLKEDSLKNLLALTKDDTTKVILLAQLSGELHLINPDSALQLAQQGLTLARQIKYPKGELFCTISLAKFWWSIGDYSTTLRLLLPNIKHAESTNDAWLRFNIYGYITSTYRDQGDYQEALKYAFKETDLEEKYNNCNLCRIYHTATASIYLEMNNLDSAYAYLGRAFLYPSVGGADGWINLIVARTQTKLKNYDSASHFYRESIKTLIYTNNQKDLAGAYNSFASVFETTGQRDSALFYAHKSLAISQAKRFDKELMAASLMLSKVYEFFNKDSALYYHKIAMAAKDSLYNQEKQRQILSYKFNEQLRQQEIENRQTQYENQIKIYALIAALFLFIIIGFILYRNNQQKQKAKLRIEKAYSELKSTQAQLIQSEKMASLGELTAGIAHEIQNPLNFVNNFSETNKELLAEMRQELKQGNYDEVEAIASNLEQNEEKIAHHGRRADSIVKGMLQHSRQSPGKKELTNINALADEYLKLSFAGLRAKDQSFNTTLQTEFDESIGKINVVPQDIGRAFLNLFNNAFYAVNEKRKQAGDAYEPKVIVSTKRLEDRIEIVVRDNGNGIPERVVEKIFQPFFTTKPTGQGTGLGLSLSYDIVKAHGGELSVKTKEGESAEFVLLLPIEQMKLTK
jgi:signal transduction histidine kinase